MNAAELHLAFNHFPIVGTVLAAPLLLLALWRGGRTGAFTAAVLVLLIAGLGSIPAVLSGEEAHHLLEGSPGIAEADVHEHEETAELAQWVALATALLAAGIWEWTRRRNWDLPRVGWSLLLAAVLVSGFFMYRAGSSGGHIRHPETTRGWQARSAEAGEETPRQTPEEGEQAHEQEQEHTH
jgi:hypothetical protein